MRAAVFCFLAGMLAYALYIDAPAHVWVVIRLIAELFLPTVTGHIDSAV